MGLDQLRRHGQRIVQVGQDQQRPFAVQYGLFLGRVEMRGEVHVVSCSRSEDGRQEQKGGGYCSGIKMKQGREGMPSGLADF